MSQENNMKNKLLLRYVYMLLLLLKHCSRVVYMLRNLFYRSHPIMFSNNTVIYLVSNTTYIGNQY